jgi:glycosyltransferase involved in cell wall biosynthesis
MKVIYASCLMSERKIQRTFQNATDYDGFQVQKFHRLLVEGFKLNNCKVAALTVLPVTRNNTNKKVYLDEIEKNNGIVYHYPMVINLPIIKHIFAIIASMFSFVSIAKKNKDVVLIADCLNKSVALGSVLGAKIMKVPSVGIVTDLPDMLLGKKDRINNWIIRLYDQYILLTEQMNDYIISNITHKQKPYSIVEGMVDVDMGKKSIPEYKKYSKKVCMYAGILDRKYGIEMLVKGFDKANIPDSELHIYGDGEYKDELLKVCKKNSNIKYFGLKPNSYIVKEQQKATLLVNPRPSDEEFTKYSFPSKNMEYMASGTPALMTRLPGMPEEYLEYVYILEDESIDGMAEKMKEILNLSKEENMEKGRKAKEYVLKKKSNINQAERVMKWLGY